MHPQKITFFLILLAVWFGACTKEYSIEDGGLKVPTGTWEFKDSLKQFQGDMDTAFISSSPGSGTKELQLIGTSLDGSQTFHMDLFADTFKTGIYKASLFQSSFQYSSPAKTLYQADQLTGEFIVIITSFSNNYVSGTFSGAALDSGNNTKNLSEGKFTSTFAATVSSGVLGDSSGNCKPVTLAGVYTQGVALNSANTVQVQVTVAVAGTYSITSNIVNGVSFSKAGVFTSTGVQTILLNGSGTPANSGNQNFTVSYGNSQCGFVINFGTPATPSNDYFPLTVNSNWTYGLVGGTASDAFSTSVIDYSPSIGGNTYKTIAFYDSPPATAFDSSYYRKPGGDYYQYVDYSEFIPFDATEPGEFIFLKDNVAAGTTWSSPTVSGTVNAIPVSASIKMTLLEKGVPVTIGTFNFPDVIKVKYEYFVTGNPVAVETDEHWFAKNTGQIHYSRNVGPSTDIYDISAFQIF
jgi:hypothetical protein